MIVKILDSSASFNGVNYNTDKMESGKGELLKVANFGVLEALSSWRPQDFKNYLKAMSGSNKLVKKPQFHAMISAKGRSYDKQQLLEIAEKWLAAMGYGKQPYLVVFHNDTDNNHVHMVSTRIGWNGRKINDSYEKIRAVKELGKIMQQDLQSKINRALTYRFTTLPQLKMILESRGQGAVIKDIEPGRIKFNPPSAARATQLKAIFNKYAPRNDQNSFADYLKAKMGVELFFHSKEGKPAYGYTVIDHAQKNAYKGSEIMPLRDLTALLGSTETQQANQKSQQHSIHPSLQLNAVGPKNNNLQFDINIAKDVDDDQIHGPRRRRKRKARTNTR
jgi:hypothetical protein